MADALKEAKNIADEIYTLTAALKLTGQPDVAEDEINTYAELMDKREPLVDKLTELTKNTTQDVKLDKTIKDIVELDIKHKEIMKHIGANLRSSIKEIKDGKRLSNKYANPMEEESGGLLDTKK